MTQDFWENLYQVHFWQFLISVFGKASIVFSVKTNHLLFKINLVSKIFLNNNVILNLILRLDKKFQQIMTQFLIVSIKLLLRLTKKISVTSHFIIII